MEGRCGWGSDLIERLEAVCVIQILEGRWALGSVVVVTGQYR